MASRLYQEFKLFISLQRYEDLLESPERVLCEMITFIDRVPCQFTYAFERIQRFTKENKLSSSYRELPFKSREEQTKKSIKKNGVIRNRKHQAHLGEQLVQEPHQDLWLRGEFLCLQKARRV